MSRGLYASPEDAEQAFYEAIETGDLEFLMSVWADDDEVICVHANGRRVVGHAGIRESWRQILGGGRRLQVRVTRTVRWQGMMLAIHSVVETLYVDNRPVATPITATNVFVRGTSGWRLLVHHASPVAENGDNVPNSIDPVPPKVLH